MTKKLTPSDLAKILGSRGGKATAEKYTKEERAEMIRQGIIRKHGRDIRRKIDSKDVDKKDLTSNV